jgi:hypothetical protein
MLAHLSKVAASARFAVCCNCCMHFLAATVTETPTFRDLSSVSDSSPLPFLFSRTSAFRTRFWRTSRGQMSAVVAWQMLCRCRSVWNICCLKYQLQLQKVLVFWKKATDFKNNVAAREPPEADVFDYKVLVRSYRVEKVSGLASIV